MLKKLLMLFVALGLSLSAVIASAVEVNTADEAALESVKGIGPVHAKAIIEERTHGGPFKDADDLANRVKGIGQKSVQNLEAAGLTINGSSAPPSGKTATTSKHTKAATTAALPAPAPAPATTTATPAPSATTPATTAAETAAAPKKRRSRKSAAAASEAAATATTAATANAASANAASAGKATKPKRSRRSKAASAAAASS